MAVVHATMRLRSQVSPSERKEAETLKLEQMRKKSLKDTRPYIDYKGKVKYYTTFMDCAIICDSLIDAANKCESIMVVGFDMEWSFSFQTGPERTAVIQISPDLDVCYILHVSKLKQLPKTLSEFLVHPKVRLTGNNIKNDVRKLARDFQGFHSDKMVENCIDLGVLANSVLPLTQRWSLEKLVDYVLDLRINKSKKVRMSKWHVIPLTSVQQKYAAIDAYTSLLLYFKLKLRESDNN